MKSKIIILIGLGIGLCLFTSCGSKQNQTINPQSLWEQNSERNNEEDKPTPAVSYPEELLSPPLLDGEARPLVFQGERLSVTDKEFFSVTTTLLKKNTNHNGIHFSKGIKNILIEGKRILFDELDRQELVRLLQGRRDIGQVTINCERLDIEIPLSIPGADVTINAKELNLLKDGHIDLTPLSQTNRPDQFEDGAQGIHGSKLVLNIETFLTTREEAPLFILNGGNGQPAGLGQDGTNGRSLPDLGGGVIRRSGGVPAPCPRDGLRPKSSNRGCSRPVIYEGQSGKPQAGEDAKQGGYPGLPGNGGSLYSSIQIPQKLIQNNPGKPGTPSPLYHGGQPGQPNPYYIIGDGRKSGPHFVEEGKDALPKLLSENSATKGRVSYESNDTWVTAGYLKFTQKYADHLHKANFIEEAKVLTEKILNQCLKDKSLLNYRESSFCMKSAKKMTPLLANLDYYGKSTPWTPLFSMESNYKLFQDELERSFKTLFLTYWTQNENLSLEKKINALSQQQRMLEAQIKRKEKSFEKLTLKVPSLKSQIENLKKEEITFERELRRIEDEIMTQARANINERNKVPFLKKALKTFAAISRVIPAGQPSLGAAATTLESIVGSFDQERPASYLLDKLPSQLSSLTPSKIETSLANWKKVKATIDYDEYKRVFSLTPQNSQLSAKEIKAEKAQYFEKLKDFATPIAKEAINQVKLYKKVQVSQSEIDREIRKLKNIHPSFNKLSLKLTRIIQMRSNISEQVIDIHKELNDITTAINDSFERIAVMSESRANFSQAHDIHLLNVLKEIESEQLDRLDYYYYLFRKAYSYRLLRQFPGEINNTEIINKIKRLAETSQEGEMTLDQLLSLKETYTAQISRVVQEIVMDFDIQYQNKKVFTLSPQQREALNQGHEIYLNLAAPQYFGTSTTEDNFRLNDITIKEMRFKSSDDAQGPIHAQLLFIHQGPSIINKGGQKYYFTLDQQNTSLYWGARAILNQPTHLEQIRPSTNNDSLLRSFINSRQEGLIFSRPGALTHFKIKLEINSQNESRPSLEEVLFEVDYDYSII